MKRQFASYVKLQLHSAASPSSSGVVSQQHEGVGGYEGALPPSAQPSKPTLAYYRTLSAGSSSNTSNSTSPIEAPTKAGSQANTTSDFYDGTSGFLRRYAAAGASGMTGGTSNAHLLTGLDRRHRSPDPPPRYNRGQSPLLLRKQLLELSGQPPGGSPLLNRRLVICDLIFFVIICKHFPFLPPDTSTLHHRYHHRVADRKVYPVHRNISAHAYITHPNHNGVYIVRSTNE